MASDENELVIRREIARSGRNRVFVNDQPVTLGLLSELSTSLIRIHTQREELGLLSPELQREWLDVAGRQDAVGLLELSGERYADYRALAQRLDRARGDDRLRTERTDLLRFQIGEIDAGRLVVGEDESLRSERGLLRHSEAIRSALGNSWTSLFEEEGSAAERMARVGRNLEGIVDWEPSAREWSRQIEQLRIGIEELSQSFRGRLEAVEADPGRLDEVEDRLAVVERLCRKYGGAVADVLALRARMAGELEELVGDIERADDLEVEVERALDQYRQAAKRLSEARQKWAGDLSERVHTELADLALEKARFQVDLQSIRRENSPLLVDGVPVAFSAQGFDRVSFTVAPNPGEGFLPVARSASGGELSRIYLALQLAVRGEGEAARASLIFDEVDSGVGGAEAAALGKKLKRLSVGGQILAVTHLAQVASFADSHFRVTKKVSSGRTQTAVDSLRRQERVEEVASGSPLPVVLGDIEQLGDLGGDPGSEILLQLAQAWPAPLTIVVDLNEDVDLPASAGSNTLGVRVPDHRRLCELLMHLGTGLTATSANRSGGAPVLDPGEAASMLRGWEALVVNDGMLRGGAPSTVVRATGKGVSVLRRGSYPLESLTEIMASDLESKPFSGGVAENPADASRRDP
jgi:DNA repair protein RecN (Recombination protein N)